MSSGPGSALFGVTMVNRVRHEGSPTPSSFYGLKFCYVHSFSGLGFWNTQLLSSISCRVCLSSIFLGLRRIKGGRSSPFGEGGSWEYKGGGGLSFLEHYKGVGGSLPWNTKGGGVTPSRRINPPPLS